MTIKTIYNLFAFLAANHSEIESFCTETQNSSSIKTYPQIYLEELGEISTSETNVGLESFTVFVQYMDRPQSNSEAEIWNAKDRMHQISNECFEMAKKALKPIRGSIYEVSKLPFSEIRSDVLSGVRVQYRIEGAKDVVNCEIHSRGLNFADFINKDIPTIQQCNVIFDTINLSQTTTLDIETIFTDITGIDKFIIQLYDPLYATWDIIQVNTTPLLVNNFSYPLPIAGEYKVRILYYDLCNLNIPTFSPEFTIVIS